VIIEKAERGSTDYAMHAIELFLDLVGIFVRIVAILLKNKQSKDKKKDSKNR
jgi:FtsH-binding integral membrane protein